jgi:hypothetical protein
MAQELEELSIKEKFKRKILCIWKIPTNLSMDDSNVIAYKYNSTQISIDDIEKSDYEKIPINKLKANRVSSWDFSITKISCDYFDSKDELDQLFIEEELELVGVPPICGKTIERISIENVLKQFEIDFSCNMSYYLDHQDEIEKDLKRKIDLNSKMNNETELKRLEQELFYNQMCELLGENEDDYIQKDEKALMGSEEMLYEKAYILRNFRMLFDDGDKMFGTARRGNFYFLFYYIH